MSDNGIMHRDIKTENILFRNKDITEIEDVVLVDFGLAQRAEDLKYIYTRCGSNFIIS